VQKASASLVGVQTEEEHNDEGFRDRVSLLRRLRALLPIYGGP